MKLKPIAQQVVVVFGASSGIGRETALRFARKGATVVVASNDEYGLRTLVEEIAGVGGTCVGMAADAVNFATGAGSCPRNGPAFREAGYVGTRGGGQRVRAIRADHARRIRAPIDC